MSQIEPGNQAKQIQFNTFNPAELDGGKPVQIELNSGAAVGQACIDPTAKIATNRIGREANAEFRNRPQDGRDEAVAVRPRPDSVIAGTCKVIVGDSVF